MRRIVSFSSIDSNRNKINVWPVAKGFRDRRGGGRCPASEGVEAVGRSDSVARTDYPLPCSVDIARLKSTSVVTHGHERFAAEGEEGGGQVAR